MDEILRVKNLSISYDGDKAVNNISFNIKKGEILGIVGQSGCGKSTLISSIVNLLPKNAKIESGEINFLGKNLYDLDKKQWRNLRGKDIAIIFQNPESYLNPRKKIGDQIVQTINNHLKVDYSRAMEMGLNTLKKMNFKDPESILDLYPFQLSGGMNQRVAISMAMLLEPKLIIADEPTSALDINNQVNIVEELKKLREEFDTSILMVTHNIGCASYLCHKIMVMRKGQIEELGETTSIINESNNNYTKELLKAIPKLKEVGK